MKGRGYKISLRGLWCCCLAIKCLTEDLICAGFELVSASMEKLYFSVVSYTGNYQNDENTENPSVLEMFKEQHTLQSNLDLQQNMLLL